MDKITLPMQITEAEQTCRERSTAAAKGGKDQSMNQLRYRSSLAILDSLCWIRDHSKLIREVHDARKARAK